MEKYWKLFNLYTNEYTTHETEEEVNHIIEFICKDMQVSRETIREEIKTPFPNYSFTHVIVYDDTAIRHFVYFFDSIEEQCDDFEERVDILTKSQDRFIDEEYELTCDNDELKRRLDNQLDEIKDLSNQLDEITKQRDNTINLLNKKTTELFNANHTIDNLRKHNQNLKEILDKINDLIHPF